MSEFAPIPIADAADEPKDSVAYYPDENGISITGASSIGLNLQQWQNSGFRMEASDDRQNWRQIRGYSQEGNFKFGAQASEAEVIQENVIYPGGFAFFRVWVLYVNAPPNRFKASISRRS